MLLRQTLIVLLKSKIDKDALLIGIGACFSLAQGMMANDSVRENILCAAQFWTGSFVLQPRILKQHLKITMKPTKIGFCGEIKSLRTNFIETPRCSDAASHCEHFERN